MTQMKDIYVDQAPVYSWPVSAVYTPYGIQGIDTNFCKRILALSEDDTEEADKLGTEISKNRHLHKEIKDNLLSNLQSRCPGVNYD